MGKSAVKTDAVAMRIVFWLRKT